MKKTTRLSIDELKKKWDDVEITQNLHSIVGGQVAAAAECHVRSNGDCSFTDECTGKTFWCW